MSAEALRGALRRLAAGESLSSEETAGAFSAVMRGEGTSAQVAALLMALRVKGETAAEITGGAMALRDAMVTLPASSPEDLVDTAGTGGGKVATFNISTAAALVAAGAGARVAKHGNRSFTTRSGGADVLEALRVRIELSVDEMRQVLDEAGIVFMFAPLMHPAMRHVGPVRRELGVPTVMNVLGPLANPAGAGRQVVGVAEAGRLSLLAEALAALGSVHALVVHGEPGMDEVSPLGITHVLEVRAGQVRPWTIDPAKFGLAGGTAQGLGGGTPSDNARIIEAVLSGKERGVARSAVILNAAAAIYVADLAPDIFEAAKLAAGAIDSGAGAAALERLKVASAKR